ncbi:hypothetical protein BOTBODRAFT_49632 [Botryobasidium botryosum FD-172 SS1]|uniref:C2H2-type domain-containing protein n=1 Tax=Botryobasidium botryosum (strain FD-172 SS1) TaxID=930990 RepID=A0A067M301_BOTB1|nr:hypothetical protein BOTBODRAFT_49632 [Botryobasidium botryosum FD-172 SS1]
MTHHCTRCGTAFKDRNKQNTHSRTCPSNPHGVVKVHEDSYEVTRNQDGEFTCLCNYHDDPSRRARVYTSVQSMKAHLRKGLRSWGTALVWQENVPLEELSSSRPDVGTEAPTAEAGPMGREGLAESQSTPQTPRSTEELDAHNHPAPSAASPPAPPTPHDHLQSSSQDSAAVHRTQRASEILRNPILTPAGLMVNTRLKALICEHCQVAVRPRESNSHLADQHPEVRLRLDLSSLEDLMAMLDVDYNQWPALPTGPVPAYDGLKTFSTGLRCTQCSKVQGTVRSMDKHFQKAHPEAEKPRKWPSAHYQQRSRGGGRDYFEVLPAPTAPPSAFEVVMAGLRAQMGAGAPERQGGGNPRLVSPWLQATGWHRHVQPYSVDELRCLAKTPTKRDVRLRGLRGTVYRYFLEATGLIEKTSVLTRQKLVSPDPTKRVNEFCPRRGIRNTPFHEHQQHGTLRQYSLAVSTLIALLLRSQQCQGVYQIPLPQGVLEALEAFRHALAGFDTVTERLHTLLMALWTTKWTQSEGNAFPCPTLRSVILRHLQEDGSFSAPKYITSTLAQLTYCMRLAFLREIHQRAPFSNEEEACSQIQPFFIEKVNSTFNGIRTAQHIVTSAAYSTASMPQVWWTDLEDWQSMLYMGDRIHLDMVRQVFVKLEEEWVHIWQNEILCGLQLEPTQHGHIADDLSNTDLGYSFLDDPRNTAFLDKERLIRAIWNDPTQRAAFFIQGRDGNVTLNAPRFQRWLQAYSRLEEITVIRAEMLAGAPGRLTELSSLPGRNILDHDGRGLYACGEHLVLVRRYLKTSGMKGHDSLIPHSLDAFTGASLLEDLAVARPFAEMAVRVLYPDRADIHSLYHDRLFVANKREFTSEDITKRMASFTYPILGVGIGIQSWRHISVAWRRKLCQRVEDLVEFSSMERVGALQSGHTTATEDRVYGLSPDAFSRAAEDLLPLFLHYSTDWHKECKVVPGGYLLLVYNAHSHLQHILGGKFFSWQAARSANLQKLIDQGEVDMTRHRRNNHEALASALVKALLPRLEVLLAERGGPARDDIMSISPPPPQEIGRQNMTQIPPASSFLQDNLGHDQGGPSSSQTPAPKESELAQTDAHALPRSAIPVSSTPSAGIASPKMALDFDPYADLDEEALFDQLTGPCFVEEMALELDEMLQDSSQQDSEHQQDDPPHELAVNINDDTKKPNAITMAHLPHDPTVCFKLTSVQPTKEIFVRDDMEGAQQDDSEEGEHRNGWDREEDSGGGNDEYEEKGSEDPGEENEEDGVDEYNGGDDGDYDPDEDEDEDEDEVEDEDELNLKGTGKGRHYGSRKAHKRKYLGTGDSDDDEDVGGRYAMGRSSTSKRQRGPGSYVSRGPNSGSQQEGSWDGRGRRAGDIQRSTRSKKKH